MAEGSDDIWCEHEYDIMLDDVADLGIGNHVIGKLEFKEEEHGTFEHRNDEDGEENGHFISKGKHKDSIFQSNGVGKANCAVNKPEGEVPETPTIEKRANAQNSSKTYFAKVIEILQPDSIVTGKATLEARDNRYCRTPIMAAAVLGDKDRYDDLVSKGCDMNKRDASNSTLLHLACSGGNVQIVTDVLARDVIDINCRGFRGMTPVMCAAERGHREVFFFLVDKGCVLTITDHLRNTVLHFACFGGSLEITEYLLAEDVVDINAKGHHEMTPVMMAAMMGQNANFEVIVQRNCDLFLLDSRSRNVLHHASFGGCEEIVEFLLSRDDVDVNQRDLNGFSAIMIAALKGHANIFFLLLCKGCELNGTSKKTGDNILHMACLGGSEIIVECLLGLGIFDINSRGQAGSSPVMMAAFKQKPEVFEFLVSRGCDLRMKNTHENTVLHIACLSGSSSMVDLILSTDDSILNSKTKESITPVLIAAEKGYRDIFFILVARGCNFSGVTKDGNTLFHCACIGGNVEIVEYVLSAKADIDERGSNEFTPIMLAAQNGHSDVFGLLLNRNCDLTYIGHNDETLLHCACSGGNADIVSYILSQEMCYINILDKKGLTPVLRAVQANHQKVFELLVKAHCNNTITTKDSVNIIHYACASGALSTAEQMVADSGLLQMKTVFGQSPLMVATLHGHKLLYDLLVNTGCDLNVKDDSGQTLLHTACYGGNVDIVGDILARQMVDIDCKDHFGRTPTAVAAKRGHHEVFFYLVKKRDGMVQTDSVSMLHSACEGGNSEIVNYLLRRVNRNVFERIMRDLVKTASGHNATVELLKMFDVRERTGSRRSFIAKKEKFHSD